MVAPMLDRLFAAALAAALAAAMAYFMGFYLWTTVTYFFGV